MVGIAIDNYGDPFRLLYGVDVKGDTCGRNNDPLNLEALSGLTNTSGEDLSDKKLIRVKVLLLSISINKTKNNIWVFSYFKNMANFEAFHYDDLIVYLLTYFNINIYLISKVYVHQCRTNSYTVIIDFRFGENQN